MKHGTMRKRSNQRGGKRTRSRGGKAVSASSLAAFESDVVCKFLEMLNTIKVYHVFYYLVAG